MSKSTNVGRRGEFLAAYILETYGVEVHHVDRSGSDLWCKVRESISTVQVKSSSVPTRYKNEARDTYTYHTPSTVVDWYCFVALDRQLLLMRRGSDVGASKVRILPNEFNEANQRRTIEEFIESC